MKVVLITLHRVTNFGSLLQTYATQSIVERLGHEVEVIDFLPEGLSFKRALWPKGHTSAFKKIVKLIPNLMCNVAQYRMVDHYLKRHIRLTPGRYRSYAELAANVPAGDVYMSGSDQVWNTQNNNPPEDLQAYYLCFVPEGKKRIALAGSFGRELFPSEDMEQMRKWLTRYDAISVREDSALRLLEQMSVSGIHVVDPTLLLSAEEWLSFCDKKKPKEGYVFVYNLNRNKTVERIAVEVAKKNRLRIVNFADTFEFISGAKNRLLNTPMDLIRFIAYADCVVTDSFHGTAFSINFHKQFICVPAPNYNTRLESILRVTGLLETRMVDTVEAGAAEALVPIDWTRADRYLAEQKAKTVEFLTQAITGD